MTEFKYWLWRLRYTDWQYEFGRLCAVIVVCIYIVMSAYLSVGVHEYIHITQIQHHNAANNDNINITEYCMLGDMMPSPDIEPYFENGSIFYETFQAEHGQGWIKYDKAYPINYTLGMNDRELEATTAQFAFVAVVLLPLFVVL